MNSIAHKCNSISSITSVIKAGFKWVEFDVRYNTNKQVVLCHDEEERNNPKNTLLVDVVDYFKNCTFIVDIKVDGIENAEHLARDVVNDISSNNTNKWYLCSFNEYCVAELADLRGNVFYKIGVISTGIPLGLFYHLNIDFVSLDYHILADDVVSALRERKLEIFAFTVNTSYGLSKAQHLCINGYIYDYSFNLNDI